MKNRLQLRLSLRRALEDTSIEALWADDLLNDALTSAIADYGARFPAERSVTVVVAAGAIELPVTGASQSGGRIVRVTDPAGTVIARNWSDEEVPPGTQRWRWWQGAIRLDVPGAPGTWRVEHLSSRLMPTNDVDPAEVIEGDESVVVSMASLYALHRRAVEDGKRGGSPSRILSTAAGIRMELERELRVRMRRARGGALSAAE